MHRTLRFLAPLLCGMPLLFWSCSSKTPPAEVFAAYTPPQAPDYAMPASWASLPGRIDAGDFLPRDLPADTGGNLVADVFFIHPTTFNGGEAWNASLADTELNAKTDEWAVRHQATVFNASCRVFAPRYRQMCFGGFFSEDSASRAEALKLAYMDIAAAFQYYLRHHNQGRPIIIAGHSQGSLHGIRLVQDFFDGTDIQPQLVAAYLAGWPFPPDRFQQLPVCQDPDDTGCVLGWCSWKEGSNPEHYDDYYKGAVTVNPISWRTDTVRTPKEAHKGFLESNYKSFKAGTLSAQVHGGILWVSKPIVLLPTDDFHVGDYNLFWLDIRANIADRIAAYQKRTARSGE